MKTSCSIWLKPVFQIDLRQKTVKRIVKELKLDRWSGIDFIAGRGISGLIGLFVAEQLKIPFATIRKPEEKCHGDKIEGISDKTKNKKYVIIDDCIETGDTLQSIGGNLHKHECLGVVIYNQDLAHYFDESFVIQPFNRYWSHLRWIPQLFYFDINEL